MNNGNKNEELLKAVNDQKTKEADKKDNKTDKTKNDLIHDPNHNFYKYTLSKFSQISSIETKFNTLEMFYR